MVTKSLQEQEKPPEEAVALQHKDNTASAQEEVMEIPQAQHAQDTEQETKSQETTAAKEPAKHYLTEVSPKEWQKHHDTWLNVVMRNTIGNPKPLVIPNLHAHIPVFRPSPDLNIDVALVKNYVTRYDL